MRRLFSLRSSSLILAGLSLCVVDLGCGVGAAPTGAITAPHIRGSVHGGQQPVSGATIQLFAAGTSGYGTGATSLLTAPVTTDSGGNFTITGDYTCPSAASELYGERAIYCGDGRQSGARGRDK